jgi:phosphoglycerate dehydrogenase-like enzyme
MKILVSDKLAAEGVSKMEEAGHEVLKAWDEPKDKLPGLIKGCDAIVVRSATKVTKDLIDAGQDLKVIGRAGIGLDNVDVEHARSKGIKVVNTPTATTVSVAELTFALILASCRDIVAGTNTTKAGKWEKKSLKGKEVYGKTLGIAGIGRIGQAVAERAVAFGMKVLAYDPYVKFAAMRDGVVILNVARGGTIDEDALYEAMKSGKVRKAALDVFEKEPPTGNRLLELPNLICTPHIGAQTEEGQNRAGVMVAEAVLEELAKR